MVQRRNLFDGVDSDNESRSDYDTRNRAADWSAQSADTDYYDADDFSQAADYSDPLSDDPNRPAYHHDSDPNFQTPYDRDQNRTRNNLADAEKNAAQGKTPGQKDTTSDIANRERADSASPFNYKDTSKSGNQTSKSGKSGGFLSKTRNKVIIAAISGLTTLTIGFFGPMFAGILAPLQFQEMIQKRFSINTESIVSKRMNAQFYKKVSESNRTPHLKGLCGNHVSVACRYSGMSNRAIRNLENRTGWRVVTGDNIIPGRSAIREIILPPDGGSYQNLKLRSDYSDAAWNALDAEERTRITDAEARARANGQVLSPEEYSTRLRNGDAQLRRGLRNAMKPSVAVWFGKRMTALFSKLGIDKLGGFIMEKTIDKVKEKIAARQARAAGLGGSANTTRPDGSRGDDGNPTTDANRNNAVANSLRQLLGGTLDGASPISGVSLGDVGTAVKGAAKGVGQIVSITGTVDTACTALNTISAIGYISKFLGAQQLIGYTMTYLSSVDGLKASGQATPAGFQALGELLFTPDADGKTAFQTYGYAMMAGDGLGDPLDTLEFRTGGGLVGDLVNLKNQLINTISGGNSEAVRSVCGVVQNPFVRIGSAALGIVATIFSGGTVSGVNIGIQAALSFGIGTAISFLIPVVASMLTGDLVGPETIGGSAGNALASGGGALHGQNANAIGLSTMTKAQALAFNEEVAQPYLAEVEADERATAGIFDITNPYSLVGSVFSSFLPYTTNSFTGTFMNFASLALNPFKLFTPAASAYTEEQYYNVCQDDDYLDLGIAADPFCNPVYGLTADMVDQDPDKVIELMYANGNGVIDKDGKPKPGSTYETFIKTCVENTSPIGFKNEDTESYVKPAECNMNNGHYPDIFWIYTVDDAVNEMSECVMDEEESACYGNSGSSTAEPTTELTGACYPGTTDLGVTDQAYISGTQTQVRLCALPNLPSTGQESQPGSSYYVEGANGGAIVNASVSGSFYQLAEAAKSAGFSPRATSSFRTMAHQTYLWNSLGQNPAAVARPGTSNHQGGAAVDFNIGANTIGSCVTINGICTPSTSSPNYALWQWLSTNSGNFGIQQYSGEYWHFSVGGG